MFRGTHLCPGITAWRSVGQSSERPRLRSRATPRPAHTCIQQLFPVSQPRTASRAWFGLASVPPRNLSHARPVVERLWSSACPLSSAPPPFTPSPCPSICNAKPFLATYTILAKHKGGRSDRATTTAAVCLVSYPGIFCMPAQRTMWAGRCGNTSRSQRASTRSCRWPRWGVVGAGWGRGGGRGGAGVGVGVGCQRVSIGLRLGTPACLHQEFGVGCKYQPKLNHNQWWGWAWGTCGGAGVCASRARNGGLGRGRGLAKEGWVGGVRAPRGWDERCGGWRREGDGVVEQVRLRMNAAVRCFSPWPQDACKQASVSA